MAIQRLQPINHERIEWCCAQQRISLDDLAKKVNVKADRLTPDSLQHRGLTFGQLKNLAKSFNRGLLFFLEAGPVDDNIHSAQFRTLANQKPDLSPKLRAIIERVEKRRELLLALSEDLESPWARFTHPRPVTGDAAATATAARAWLGLSDQTIAFDDYRLAVEHKGVLVVRSNGYAGRWQVPPNSSIAGFSLYYETCPVIFVRKLEPETRQTFTMMHELGHLMLHQQSFVDSSDDLFSVAGREREANTFAGTLLVPNERLIELDQVGTRPTDIPALYSWLRTYSHRWGVSGEVILRRMLDTGRASPAEYNAYRLHVNRLPAKRRPDGGQRYRHREPKHIFGRRYVRTVFDALRTNNITLSKASTYLDNLKIGDLQQLEAHIADV